MKKTLTFVIAFALSSFAIADEQTIDKKKQIAWEKYSWDAVRVTDAITLLNQQSLTDCPSGFEKLREYTTREDDKYFLHFVIRCITPATLSATIPAEPK